MQLVKGNIVEDMQRWVDAYLGGIKAEGRAERTLSIYAGILEELVEYSRAFQEEITLEDVNRLFISSFFNDRAAQTGRGFSPSTKQLYLNVLKQFLTYVSENNHDGVDLVKSLKKMSISAATKEKPAFNEDELRKILITLEKMKNSGKRVFTTVRNVLMFKLFLYTGMRANELAQLRFCDLEPHELDDQEIYQILVQGKGQKERFIYVARSLIEDEMDTLGDGAKSDELIALSSTGKPLGSVQIWQNLSRIYKKAGVCKSGVHILRHTLARRLVAKGENLEVIRNILGHATITTTVKFYAKASEKDKATALLGVNGVKKSEKG